MPTGLVVMIVPLIQLAHAVLVVFITIYIKHNVLVKHHVKELSITMYLAYVLWFKKHPEKHHFHLPNTVWYPDYVSFSEASFMPVSRIACRCMKGELELFFPERPFNNGKAIVINPISAGHFSF